MAVSFQLLRSSTASKRPNASSLAAGELGLNFSDSTSGLFYENASGNVMKVGPAEVGTTAPNASPASGGSSGNSLGELWYDTGNSILKVYNGSSFVVSADVTTITGVTAGTVSASKAVVVDSNKDITGFRNVTATGDVTIPEGDLILGSAAVTSTAAELNLLDGVTAGTVTASKALVVDANKDLASLRNLTLTGDLTVPEGDLILGSTAVTSTAAELNLVDGITAGTVSASKAVIVDADKDVTGFRNITLTGELDVATLDVSSTSDFAGDVTFSTAQDISVIDNSGLALRIMESTNEYLRVITTDGSESVTIKKTLETDGDLQVDGGITPAAETNINLADNSGYALRFIEGSNEYMRFTTTDGSEKIQTAKELEVNGALNIDGAVDCSGDVTFSDAQTIKMTDNLGFALRIMEDTNEYVRFVTTDGSELVDFTKSVKLDGGVDIAGAMTITGDIDCTLDSGTSNALDFVISGGNRMMRFNTNTETVLLEQNFEVDGTATFDGAMDIDNTMDISGGDVTFSANADIHIPDNSGQALDIDEGTNNYVRFITTDGSEKIQVAQPIEITGSTLTFDSVGVTAIQTSGESFADNDTSLMTSAAIDDRIGAVGVTETSGTATLTFVGFSSSPDPKLTVTAYYVKVGKMVTITFETTQNFGSYSGSATITGLPFGANTNTDFFGTAHHDGALATSANDGVVSRIRGAANTTIDFMPQESGIQLSWSGTNSSKDLAVTITYFTA